VLFAAITVLVGAAPADVAYFASLWLSLTIMIGMIRLRQSYLALTSSARTFLSVLLVLAAESRARGWGLPLAAALTLVQLRGVARERA
jgi:hypothetical protein